MLEDMGNAVCINEQHIIPAVNIQVDGFPRLIDEVWYGVYFEIMFECGCVWEVNQGFADPNQTSIEVIQTNHSSKNDEYIQYYDSWEDFLFTYRYWLDPEPGAMVS